MDTSKYAELFLTESRDNLVATNEALLRLERDPHDGEAIDAAFRAVHTIKGMAGVMGYTAVADLAHDMEALLAGARDEQRGLRNDDPPLLLEATDALEAAIEASVAGRGGDIDVSALCGRLRGWATATHAVPSTVGEFLLPQGDGLAVTVTLGRDAPLRGARAMLVLERARTLGEVTAVVPDEDALAAERFESTFAFRLRSNATPELIGDTLREAGFVESVRVAREGLTSAADAAAAAERADSAWAAGTLKAPLQRYVRIDLRRLDGLMNLMGELVIARGRLEQAVVTQPDAALHDVVGVVSRLIGDMQTGILSSRMVPVWQVFDRFPRVVRDAARSLGKELDFTIEGREIELDRALLDQIGDPLVHLLRNAIDHGIEEPHQRESAGKARTGKLILSAARDRSSVVIRVTDDGKGIDRTRMLARGQAEGIIDPARAELSDEDLLKIIAMPGFSTAERVTTLSGRGVGVDAVVSRVRSIGGSLELKTTLGKGTSITIRLPVTLAIIQALLARVGDETYALPLTHVRETLQLTPSVVRRVRGNDVLVLREEVLPLLSLRRIVELPVRDQEGSQVVVLEVADRRAGLVVDQLRGQQEIVVKPIDGARGAASCFSGATILGDGVPALILEATSLL